MELRHHLKNLADLQCRLLESLKAGYSVVGDLDDWGVLRSLPTKGQIELDGSTWSFKRHGMGFRFVRDSDRLTVDAHRLLGSYADGIDTWRALQYLESLNLDHYYINDEKYELGESEIELRKSFQLLLDAGAIEMVENSTYKIA